MAERGSLDALAVVKRIRDAVDQAQEGHDPAAHRAIIRAALDELDAALAQAEPLGDDVPPGHATLKRWRDWLHRTLQLHDA